MALQPRRIRAARRGAGGKTVVLILAIVGGLLVVGCLACGGLFYFGFNAAMDAAGQVVKEQFADHPVIQEHLGGIETSKPNLMDTAEIQQEFGENHMAFDVSGPQGSGTLVVRQVAGDQFEGRVLRTPDGTFELEADEQEVPPTDEPPAGDVTDAPVQENAEQADPQP